MEVGVKLKSGYIDKKNIFDAATKKVLLNSIQNGKVIQTQDTETLEEFVVLDANGHEVAKLRENYERGRSTILVDGQEFTKVDRKYLDGSINKGRTSSESSENLNTINEKDFSEIYGIVATKAVSR